jgi:hypothetical protein
MFKFYKYLKNRFFTSSNKYWESRYLSGENSGAGSYSDYAKYKAGFINEIIKKYNIKTVTELGCGDANNLKLYKGFDKYYGFDVSQTVISRNNKEFDSEKISFKILKNSTLPNCDLYMSLDVIYHLVENVVFKNHIKDLFSNKSEYVLIYSSNHNSFRSFHVKHRKWTKYVPKNYNLLYETNKGFLNSSALFFLYKKL